MIKWEFFFKKREISEFAINKEESSDIENREISLIYIKDLHYCSFYGKKSAICHKNFRNG
jgi:hypothetical protein